MVHSYAMQAYSCSIKTNQMQSLVAHTKRTRNREKKVNKKLYTTSVYLSDAFLSGCCVWSKENVLIC